MTLDAQIGLQLGSLDLDVELRAAPGEVVALLGPNGAGKSTVLRCLAGLVPLDRGCIEIDGVVVDDPAGDVLVEPEDRPTGFVFQDYVLFDHLSVVENVAYGMRARGTAKREARQRAHEWLERFDLADYAPQRPGALSGGQAQRVALARALATSPRLLLLDEPLAALDAGTRANVRRDLRRHLAGFDGMRLVVTHDPVDAYALADRVVVLESGRIVQTGTLAEVTAHPRTRYVADLVGVNLIVGDVVDGVLTTPSGARVVIADAVRRPDVGDDPPALGAARPWRRCRFERSQHLARHDQRHRPTGRASAIGDRRRVGAHRRDHRCCARRPRPATRRRRPCVGEGHRHRGGAGVTRSPTDRRRRELLLGEWACLGVLYEGRTHGFAIASTLRPGGELGRVWTLSRALTYRSLDQLLQRDLIRSVGEEPGIAGGNRTLLEATRSGRAELRRWLAAPVVHLRDLRSELLLKLVIAERCDIDVTPMLQRQRTIVAELATVLRQTAPRSDGTFGRGGALAPRDVRGSPPLPRPSRSSIAPDASRLRVRFGRPGSPKTSRKRGGGTCGGVVALAG